MSEWISVKDKAAPKTGKFLFYYHCGIGLGCWTQAYTTINGNSERTHKCYFLVLWPCDISENDGEPMQWSDDKMIEMDMYWMPLPNPPIQYFSISGVITDKEIEEEMKKMLKL